MIRLIPSLVPSPRVCLFYTVLALSFAVSASSAQQTGPSSGPVIGVPRTQPAQKAPAKASPGTQLPIREPVHAPPAGTTIAEPQSGSLIPTGQRFQLPSPTAPNAGSPAQFEQAGDENLQNIPSSVSPDVKALEQQPVYLFDKEKLDKGRALLNNVLTASVVKVQEYPVDLPTILKLVEAQNLLLQDFTLNAKIRNNQFYRSLAEMLPDVEGTYNQSRFQGAIQIFGSQTLQVYQTRIVPQATASWVIRPGGQDLFTALAAKQRARGAKYDLNNTLQDQLTQATIEYYELLAAGVNVANTRANIQEVQTQVALNDARLKAGVGTKLDLERARTLLIEREQELITNENNLAKAQQNLLNRLNLDPNVALLPPQVRAEPRILVPLDVNTEALVDKAVVNNPSLKVIEQEIRAIGYEGKAVLGNIIPTVTLTTYINGTGPEIDKLGLGRFGGFAVQSNLLDSLGTAIPLDYRTKRLQVAQQKVRYKTQVRTVQTAVINSFLDNRAGAKSIFTAQEQLDVAEEAYRLSFGRYKAGLGINVDLLNAQSQLALARGRMVRAIFDFNESQVRLLQALGEVSPTHILNGMKSDDFKQQLKPAP